MAAQASYGVAETEKLKTNVQEQLNRLLTQLQDLQELRHELDDDEYEETRIDTLQEMEVGRRVAVAIAVPRARLLTVRHRSGAVADAAVLRIELTCSRGVVVLCAAVEQEFDTQLKRLMEGNVSLVDALGSVKLALQASTLRPCRRVSESFRLSVADSSDVDVGADVDVDVGVAVADVTSLSPSLSTSLGAVGSACCRHWYLWLSITLTRHRCAPARVSGIRRRCPTRSRLRRCFACSRRASLRRCGHD